MKLTTYNKSNMAQGTLKPIENAMKVHLRSLGYFKIEIKRENRNERSFEVIAEGALRKMFIKVLIFWANEEVGNLSSQKILSIKREAKRNEKEAWAAIMKVDKDDKIVKEIKWTNLSKQTV